MLPSLNKVDYYYYYYYPVQCEHLYDIRLSTLEIGPAQLRPVTEIAPTQPFLCLNRSPFWHDLRGCAKAIRYSPVADPGEGPGEPAPTPLFLDQNEARRAEKKFLETAPPLSQGLDDRPPSPPYLKAWIHHCSLDITSDSWSLTSPDVVLPTMAYTGRFRLKGVPFSGFRYMKG